MIVNVGTRVATLNNFFTPGNVASIDQKMLQYTTLSLKLHHRTLRERQTHVSLYQTSLPVPRYNAWIKNKNQTGTKYESRPVKKSLF